MGQSYMVGRPRATGRSQRLPRLSMGRRILRKPGVPALLVSAVAATAFALWDPPVRDLAAHTFRAEYFDRYGLAIWNGTWYAGHYLLTYSVLFPPLAGLLDPVWVGAVSAVACAYLFDRLVQGRWGRPAAPAGYWFAALGSLALLANGWLAFALGLAIALGCLRALQTGRVVLSAFLGALTALGSPVAAFLLTLVLVPIWLDRRRRSLVVVAAAVLIPGLLLAVLFHEDGGTFPFWFSAYWPLALTCVGALVVIRGLPEERPVQLAVIVYLAAGTLLWLVPTPVGGNITRLGSLFAGPVLAAILLAHGTRAPRILAAAVLVLAFCWQVITPLPDTFQSLGDPSTERSYYKPLARWLDAHDGARARIEVPYTFNHWETAYLSPRFSLARGWLRQLDRDRNDLFYEGRLTNARYRAWLSDRGIRYVALADAELDYSAEREADLVRAEPQFLTLRAKLPHWRVYEVTPPGKLINGAPGARVLALGARSVEVSVARPGTYVLRVTPTPYRRIEHGAGCVGRAGDWTKLRADRPGRLTLSVDFSLGRAVKAVRDDYPDCR